MNYRAQIKENRIKWANFLMEPGRESANGVLELYGTEKRCCLGHAAFLFELPSSIGNTPNGDDVIVYDGERYYAPTSLIDLLGLWNEKGASKDEGDPLNIINGLNFYSLSLANDNGTSPRVIGEYILTVIEGGDDTPFRPLSEYAE